MKKYIPYLFAGLAVLSDACQNPVQDVELKFKDPMPVSVEMRFRTATGELPKDFSVKVVGPDAARVVSPLNTARYRVLEDGTLFLSVSPAAAPSATSPLRFSVVATASGYADVVQPVELNSLLTRRFALDVLRKGSATAPIETKAVSDASGTMQAPVTISAPSSDGATATLLSIAQGTQVKDGSGQAVDGPLNIQVQPVTTSSVTAAAAELPGNGILAQPGANAPSQQIKAVAGAVKIEIFNEDYQTVKTFSKPVRLVFALESHTVNPVTKRLIQPGDVIPLFSYDIATQRWQQEPAGQVERNAQGSLEYVTSVSHLSYWMAAFTESVCDAGPIFRVASPIPSGNLLYRCQVIDAATGQPLSNAAGSNEFRSTINDGQFVSLANLPSGSRVRLRVYDNESSTVVTSGAVEACSNETIALDLSSFKRPAVLPVAVRIALQFPCAQLNEAKLPTKTIYAQYRETGTKEWKNLPVLKYEAGKTSFSIETYELAVGKTYDFRAGPAQGSYPFEQPAYKLAKAEWVIEVDTDEYCR